MWSEVKANYSDARPQLRSLLPSPAGPLESRKPSGLLSRRCATTVLRTLQMALGNQFWREGICFQGDSPAPQACQFTAVPPPQVSVYVSELCQHSVTGSVSDWILVMRTPLDCRHLGHSVNSSYVSEHAVLTCQILASVHQVPLPTVRHVAVAICILNAPPSMACVVKAWFLAHRPLGQGGRTFRRWSLLEGR